MIFAKMFLKCPHNFEKIALSETPGFQFRAGSKLRVPSMSCRESVFRMFSESGDLLECPLLNKMIV